MPSYANPDGTFTKESAGGAVTVVAPATDDTVRMLHDQSALYVNNAATLAALTVQLPAPARRGHRVEIVTRSAITALTITDRFGNASAGPDSAAAKSTITMRWISPEAGWVEWYPPGVSPSTLSRTRVAAAQHRSFRPFLKSYVTVGANVYSLSGQWGLETDFDMVRLVWNNTLNQAYTIQGAIVAPSAQPGNRANPINAAGTADATLFRTVYFNNNGANLRPDQQTAWGTGPTTATVPANTGSASQPTYFFSDWVRVPSLPRRDGGNTTLLNTRVLTDNAGTHLTQTFGTAAIETTWDGLCQGRYAANGYAIGDFVTINQGTMSASLFQTHLSPHGVEYYGRSSGVTMMVCGDSLTQGVGGDTVPLYPWGARSAFALSSPTFPVAFCNYGWGGQTSPDYLANFYRGFDALSPEIVTFPVWTPNDAVTQDGADAGFSRAMEATAYAVKRGAVMLLFGPTPWGGITTTPQETARLSARTRMLEAANGYNVFALDVESLGTGESPNRLQAAYESANTANHYSDAGNDVIDRQILRPVLRHILGV